MQESCISQRQAQCHSWLYILMNVSTFHFMGLNGCWAEGFSAPQTQSLWEAERYVEGCPTSAPVNSPGPWSSMTCLFALAEHMSQAPGPISEYAVYSQPRWVFAAKISNPNCQIAKHWEEKRVYLLLTATRIKQTARGTGWGLFYYLAFCTVSTMEK